MQMLVRRFTWLTEEPREIGEGTPANRYDDLGDTSRDTLGQNTVRDEVKVVDSSGHKTMSLPTLRARARETEATPLAKDMDDSPFTRKPIPKEGMVKL